MTNEHGKDHRGKGQKRGRQLDARAVGEIRVLLAGETRRRDLLIEHLHKIQDHYHGISRKHLHALAVEMKLSQAEVYEVASFYQHFDLLPDDSPVPPAITLRVCQSLSCQLAGADRLFAELQRNTGELVRLIKVPCLGRCHDAPVAQLGCNPIAPADAQKLQSAIDRKQVNARPPRHAIDYSAYLDNGGYKLYADCVEGAIQVEQVLQNIQESGLRGLGGAGFPVAKKWRIVRDQPGDKLLVVNIDEGEPGTFKDRFYLEQDPHRLLEGALIAAWAIEAEAIYIYLRDEYASIRLLLQREIECLKQRATTPLPAIHLRRGAGSYVCGEESALIESLQGNRGMPRLRPPYIAEKGLFGQPTLEHNMETLYWLRDILEKGPDWLAGQGRNGRSGMRSYSVSGRVNDPGVYRAPAGITVRQLIDEYCGGMQDGHELYGYFPGGASGGMLPAALDKVPLDFDTLQPYGCFIGSAAVIVFSRSDSAKDLALNAMKFFADESCGQCTPCRVGTVKAIELMQQSSWDTALLQELSTVMIDASICGLGQAAPNPLLCAIKYFTQEFDE